MESLIEQRTSTSSKTVSNRSVKTIRLHTAAIPGMAKLRFFGLGLMSYAMARNLVRDGHQVAVWSNTASNAQQLASEENAVAYGSPKEVAEQLDSSLGSTGPQDLGSENRRSCACRGRPSLDPGLLFSLAFRFLLGPHYYDREFRHQGRNRADCGQHGG